MTSAACVGLSCQSLFATIKAPFSSRNSSVGLASTALAGKNAGARLGPIPRSTETVQRCPVAQHHTRDHDVLSSVDKGSRADVRKFPGPWIQVVHFHQRHPGRRVFGFPRTTAVYDPGANVATIADSRSSVGANPVA